MPPPRASRTHHTPRVSSFERTVRFREAVDMGGRGKGRVGVRSLWRAHGVLRTRSTWLGARGRHYGRQPSGASAIGRSAVFPRVMCVHAYTQTRGTFTQRLCQWHIHTDMHQKKTKPVCV